MHVILHALLLVAALPAAALLRLRVPSALGIAALAAAHWLWALWEPSHAALALAAILFWSPVARGRAGPGYILAGLFAADTAALGAAMRGDGSQSVEMLASMLPLALAFVIVAWRWLSAEDVDARAA